MTVCREASMLVLKGTEICVHVKPLPRPLRSGGPLCRLQLIVFVRLLDLGLTALISFSGSGSGAETDSAVSVRDLREKCPRRPLVDARPALGALTPP